MLFTRRKKSSDYFGGLVGLQMKLSLNLCFRFRREHYDLTILHKQSSAKFAY